jgi:serine phosphatase RsbU (regulator of sigma subunit)
VLVIMADGVFEPGIVLAGAQVEVARTQVLDAALELQQTAPATAAHAHLLELAAVLGEDAVHE